MASAVRYPRAPAGLLLVLARIVGDRAVYGVLVDPATRPGTIRGVAGPLQTAISRRRFLAGDLPAAAERAAWGQRQHWAFPLLDMRLAPVLGNDLTTTTDQRESLPKTASYRQEYVRCGKPTCTRCSTAAGHGPYWYAYWRQGGRLHKRYLGKTQPQPVSEKGGTPFPST